MIANSGNKMKKYFILLLLLCGAEAFGITNGIYKTEDDWILSVVNHQMFLMIDKSKGYVQAWPDTIAACKYEEITDNIILVSPLVSVKQVEDSVIIERSFDPSLHDSICFVFDAPGELAYILSYWLDALMDLQTVIHTKGFQYKVQKDILLWRWDSLIIRPKTVQEMLLIGGCSLYPACLWVKTDIELDEQWNVYKFSLPLLDTFFFMRYQIVNEYMFVTENSIKWRGWEFIREE